MTLPYTSIGVEFSAATLASIFATLGSTGVGVGADADAGCAFEAFGCFTVPLDATAFAELAVFCSDGLTCLLAKYRQEPSNKRSTTARIPITVVRLFMAWVEVELVCYQTLS